ncbi:hypothetical protein Dsin_016747 [Dipteronia sinensis]|uniref:Zinc knuckle CX2CX4HX4C domain-containing protein n=1 Tax=Dipteronia sinensis TaxID=43782 RepID=A0AAE0AEA8_9ROSI|nr:hypothetical protein Dsin_016747 [Dipteronia sinensis]
MDAFEIAKLCESLSLAEEDGVIHQLKEGFQQEGLKDIAHCLVGKVLSGKKVGLWVQIHNIPIMCMNRRTAKWLEQQIGDVLEIPADSKEYWGKFIRVKIQVNISRPLKRWMCLKLDRSNDIVVVALKYERLPEFCYAYGKIGHGLRECPDDDARTNALEGSTPKFGAWMRAAAPDRSKPWNRHMESGESSRKDRSGLGTREPGARIIREPNTTTVGKKRGGVAGKTNELKEMKVMENLEIHKEKQ